MRTCTAMLYTDGKTSRYGVFHGRMRGRSFDSGTAEIVAVYEFTVDSYDPLYRMSLYRELTAKHATKKAPAVRWQA